MKATPKTGALAAGIGLVVCLAVGLTGGCGTDKSPDRPGMSGTGTLAVRLQASGTAVNFMSGGGDPMGGGGNGTQLQSLSLTFDSIRAFPAAADTDSTEPPRGERDEDPFTEVLTGPVTVDVMQLADTLTVLLGTANLPSGKYTHLSLHLAAASGVTAGGQTVTVDLPNPNDFLMINVPFTVENGAVSEIQISIDLGRSVHEVPPGSGHFLLKPVLHGAFNGEHGGGNVPGTPLQSLSLTIDAIRLFSAEADSAGDEGSMNSSDRDGSGDHESFLDFPISSMTVDVMQLGSTLTTVLDTLKVPNGRFSHLAVHVSAASGVTSGGQTVTVETANENGFFMIVVPFTVANGAVSAINTTIDLSQVVREIPPGSGHFVLEPVGRAEDDGGHGGGHDG